MSAENIINQANNATVGLPALIGNTVVYDLFAQRKRIDSENSDGLSQSPLCDDGVCVLSWRPRKPRNDAA
jgi:hypothetical protein